MTIKDTPTYRYAQVALDVPLMRTFDYLLADTIPQIGQRVAVPFGHGLRSGIVVGLTDESEFENSRIKNLAAVYDDMPVLSSDILRIARFAADYYQTSLGEMLATMLPVSFRGPGQVQLPVSWFYVANDFAALKAQLPKRAPLQHRLAEALQSPCSESVLKGLGNNVSKLLSTWREQGLIAAMPAPETPCNPTPSEAPTLTEEQATAVTSIINTSGYQAFLLHGITGSGKTEVYLRCVASCLKRGQQSLILVPEINLTPQLISRFRERFPGARIGLQTSQLAETERTRTWVDAALGKLDIILGTRLAVFTPLPRLGLILIDEEHDASYKQQDGVRYSARDMAIYRANLAQTPVVLGSATPALESWQNAQLGRYKLLTLSQRATPGAKPPRLQLVSTKGQKLEAGLTQFCREAIQQRLSQNEQVLIFLNRRGYAPALHCDACGWMAGCRHCSAKLVVHLGEKRLRCHHCGNEQPLPDSCPDCGNQDILPVGMGTQRLEDQLSETFPQTRILRLDRDSTSRKGSLETMLGQIHRGEADILIGTQLLAKGHDFPRLTLVVILNADGGLFSADFRASERLFAQLTQVAGRAGRANLPGDVLIQTRHPEHPFYGGLLHQDYQRFAESALKEREEAAFPPFSYQAILRADSATLGEALSFLKQAKKSIQAWVNNNPDVWVFDPTPAVMTRLAGRERAHILLQSANRPALLGFVREWTIELGPRQQGKTRWHFEIDPLDIG